MYWLPYLLLLFPLALVVLLAAGLLTSQLRGTAGEVFTVHACTLSTLGMIVCAAVMLFSNGGNTEIPNAVAWFSSGNVHFALAFASAGMPVWLSLLFSIILLLIYRFSASYLHAEAGFVRFFLFLAVLSLGLQLLLLSDAGLVAFVGWELAGLSSWVLIAYNFGRLQAAANATRVFLFQRAGDGAFLLGLVLMLLWTGSDRWSVLLAQAAALPELQVNLIATAFAGAAMVKSAQFPFTPWLFRAMEGPTPSSTVFYGALMVHAGVFLVIVLAPVFEHADIASALLLVAGALTTIFAWITGKTQTDIKSSQACATAGQIGLMFIACGLHWWDLALWHLCAHAVVRCYLFLTSQSILHNAHKLPVVPQDAPASWLKQLSLQQFWLDPFLDWLVLRPVKRLARDLSYFEVHVLDPLLGSPVPVVRRVSQALQKEEARIGARLDNDENSFAHGSGLAGKLTALVASLSHWFEERFILQGIGRDMISQGRRLGHAANRFELLLLRPRYLVMFVLITLLVAM